MKRIIFPECKRRRTIYFENPKIYFDFEIIILRKNYEKEMKSMVNGK